MYILAGVSVFCWILEYFFSLRKQEFFKRKDFIQDVLWLITNGGLFEALFPFIVGFIISLQTGLFFSIFDIKPGALRLLADLSLWQQVVILFIVSDFLDYWLHLILHRVPMLWHFHKVHHSIKTMDFLGNFRFHWIEIVFYKSLKFLPLAILAPSAAAFTITALLSTLIGNLNHSNLNLRWGPLRKIINSPVFHLYHHEKNQQNRYGCNFGVCLCFWDYLFGTASSAGRPVPAELGFPGEETLSESWAGRFLMPADVLFNKIKSWRNV